MDKAKKIFGLMLYLLVLSGLTIGISHLFQISHLLSIGVLFLIIIAVVLIIMSPLFDLLVRHIWPLIFIVSVVTGFFVGHMNGSILGIITATLLYLIFRCIRFLYGAFFNKDSVTNSELDNVE